MNAIKSNLTVELILFQLDTSNTIEFSVHDKYLVKIICKKGEYQLDILDLSFKSRLIRCRLKNKAQLIYTITELVSSYRNIHCYNFPYKFSGSFSLTARIFAFLWSVGFILWCFIPNTGVVYFFAFGYFSLAVMMLWFGMIFVKITPNRLFLQKCFILALSTLYFLTTTFIVYKTIFISDDSLFHVAFIILTVLIGSIFNSIYNKYFDLCE